MLLFFQLVRERDVLRLCGAHLESINFSKHQCAVQVLFLCERQQAARGLLRTPLHAGSARGVSEEVAMVKPWGKDASFRSRDPGNMTCLQEGLHKARGADNLRRITHL